MGFCNINHPMLASGSLHSRKKTNPWRNQQRSVARCTPCLEQMSLDKGLTEMFSLRRRTSIGAFQSHEGTQSRSVGWFILWKIPIWDGFVVQYPCFRKPYQYEYIQYLCSENEILYIDVFIYSWNIIYHMENVVIHILMIAKVTRYLYRILSSLSLSVQQPVQPSIYLPTYLPACLPTYLPVCRVVRSVSLPLSIYQ